MKTDLRYAVACVFLCAVPAVPVHATEGGAKPSIPQSRLAACSLEAKGLKGEEHDQLMSRCLKGHEQQNRMKSCNEQAGTKDLHGDARRSFMSACLKG